jgi:ABC-type amino acid transport substrate-binding protein
VYYTEERAQQFYYTRPNVYDQLTFLFDDSTDFTGPESLRDLRAASISFWVYTPYMEEFWGEDNMVYAPGQTELFEMIRGGQVDVTIGGGAGPTALEGADPDSGLRAVPLEEGDLGIPEEIRTSPSHMIVNCANVELAAAIDEVLVDFTESGHWAEVLVEHGLLDEAIIVPTSVGQPEQLCG